ncbi:MAG: cation/acetate symporter, partial [Halieaceae bacterium]
PGVAAFSRLNLSESINETPYAEAPSWFKNWEGTGLLAWQDKNDDGIMQYRAGNAFQPTAPLYTGETGSSGQRLLSNLPSANDNEIYVDRDIMVMSSPEVAGLPAWVIALMAAGAVAAALSTAAGLLLVISSSVSHDLLKSTWLPGITERQELLYARIAAASAIVVAGWFGINPPAFVAQVVAFAFGLAAASLFPAIFMGIFFKGISKEGAITGMLLGLVMTFSYIVYFKFMFPELDNPNHWWFGISPQGIGVVGAMANAAAAVVISRFTPAPPKEVQAMVDSIRLP